MKNRAKCKLCHSVIESFFKGDYVECECGEIAVYDGEAMRVAYKAMKNFLRLDDEGNEYPIKYEEKKEQNTQGEIGVGTHKPTKEELIQELDNMIKAYDGLPYNASMAPVTHADHHSLLMVLSSIFKAS